jgi:hypothetical protein
MICKQCGFDKTIDRFFYHSAHKRYSYICKRCEIKNARLNRNRAEIRGQKNIEKIKDELNNDDSYMRDGINYLAEILTNILYNWN